MNIFVTSVSPVDCAKVLDDKRVIKMVLESAQMLSTAITLCGGVGPYKVTHANHPCSVWVRANRENYHWLLDHFQALCDEYTLRYGKVHKCHQHYNLFATASVLIPVGDRTPFANCSRFDHFFPGNDDETIACYRQTMHEKWNGDKRTPTWKQSSRPVW